MNPDQIRDGIEYVNACLDDLYANRAEDGTFTDEQQARWDEGIAYVREQNAAIERAERLEAERAEVLAASEHARAYVPGSFNINTRTTEDPFDLSTVDRSKGYDAEVVSRAATAIEKSRHFISDDHRERATRLVERLGNDNRSGEQILLAASPAYRSAFFKAQANAASPGTAELTAEERQRMAEVDHVLKSSGFWNPVDANEARALALTNVTGKLVPAHLDPSIVLTNDGAINPFRAISRQESITTNVWTGVSSDGITAGWTGAEASEVDDDAPSFSSPAVTAYMADAFVPISFQGYEDWGRGEAELERMFVDAKDRLEATAFATGSGTNEPIGIVTALDANTNVEVSMATNSAYAIADVYTLFEALPARYRSRASFVSHLAFINRTRQFGTSNNYHGFTVDLTAEGIPAVLGKRWYESTAMSSTLSTATNNSVVYGDFSNYLIADRIGMVLEFVPNLFHASNLRPSGQRGWLVHWRTGADSINDKGFRLLQNPT